MKRLIVAAGVALLIHALFFGLKVKWPEEANISYTKAPLQLLQVEYKKKVTDPSPPSFKVPSKAKRAPRGDGKDSNKKKVKQKNYKKVSKASLKVLKKARVANNLEQKETRPRAAFDATHFLPDSPPTPLAKFYAYDEQHIRTRSIQKVKQAPAPPKGKDILGGVLQSTPYVTPAKSEISNTQEKGQTPATPPLTETSPAYRENPPPVYPLMARRRGYEGMVVLKVLVNRRGGVDELHLIKSSGYKVLDRAAMDCVRDWVFEPGTRGGKSVKMWVRVPIRFCLKGKH